MTNKESLIDIKITLITALFLISSIFFKLPYGYYTLLRFIVCGYFAYATYLLYNKEKLSFLCTLFGLLAIVYNPFEKLSFDRDTWRIINGFTLLLLYIINKKLFLLSKK